LSFVLKSFTSFSVGAGGAYCIFLDGDLLLTKGKGDSRVHRRLITYGVSIGQESFGLRGGRMDTSADEEGVYILWNMICDQSLCIACIEMPRHLIVGVSSTARKWM
jgi:hypothetical protein